MSGAPSNLGEGAEGLSSLPRPSALNAALFGSPPRRPAVAPQQPPSSASAFRQADPTGFMTSLVDNMAKDLKAFIEAKLAAHKPEILVNLHGLDSELGRMNHAIIQLRQHSEAQLELLNRIGKASTASLTINQENKRDLIASKDALQKLESDLQERLEQALSDVASMETGIEHKIEQAKAEGYKEGAKASAVQAQLNDKKQRAAIATGLQNAKTELNKLKVRLTDAEEIQDLMRRELLKRGGVDKATRLGRLLAKPVAAIIIDDDESPDYAPPRPRAAASRSRPSARACPRARRASSRRSLSCRLLAAAQAQAQAQAQAAARQAARRPSAGATAARRSLAAPSTARRTRLPPRTTARRTRSRTTTSREFKGCGWQGGMHSNEFKEQMVTPCDRA